MRHIRAITLVAILLALFSALFVSAMLYALDVKAQDVPVQDVTVQDVTAQDATVQETTAQAATLSGRVSSVFDDYPLDDVEIHLINALTPSEPIVAAITDHSGHYTVTQLLTGTWIVRFVPSSLDFNSLAEYYNDVYDIEDATPITLSANAAPSM